MSRGSRFVARAGFGAALLGTAAGAAEVVVGTSPLLGDKNDPTTLGLVTVCLAVLIGAAGWSWRWATTPLRAVAAATAMLGPALLGTTTAGVAWAPAGAVAALGGICALRQGATLGSISNAVRGQWAATLVGCLALIYVALGVVARGGTGVLAVAGGVSVAAALALHRRFRAAAALTLVAGAVPFAAAAPSTVVAPLTGLLILVVGLPVVLRRAPGEALPLDVGVPVAVRRTS